MAYSDKKVRKSRSRGVTQADRRRWDAQRRREARAKAKAEEERKRMLGAMSPGEREEFLAEELAEKLRIEEEADENRERYAKQLRLEREQLVADSRLMAGFIHSEIATAVSWKETYGHQEGDWLDDPVAALTGQGGFGEEVSKSTGIKLQIHLCLDCSNSMVHNRVDQVSVEVMRTMYLALDQASKQLPTGSLTVHMWKWALDEDGKRVDQVTKGDHWTDLTEPGTLAEGVNGKDPRGYTRYLPSASYQWTGEDTWIHPLLEALDAWETVNGDPGAYRLDIIISDGILEHPTDARKGDVIQDRRDGNLQSIVLNFLPMEDWGDYRVPNRCVQYPATAENLMGLMRAILGDWLVQI